jgi:hypothetical protein
MKILSHLSKLTSFSLVFPSLHSDAHPSSETVEKVMNEIKAIGKKPKSSQESVDDIKKILYHMKKYSSSLDIQRIACHVLSNLATQVMIAKWVIKNNGFDYISAAMSKFEHDYKLCWLASSAIWNLARVPANRNIIGKHGVKLMLRILSLHSQNHEKVTNTAIGALSNLSLCEELKDCICKQENIELIIKVLKDYAQKQSVAVLTSGAGLLANLAVNDVHANYLLQFKVLPTLLQLLHWKIPNNNENINSSQSGRNQLNETLHRNTCAAINNMVTADNFLEEFLKCRGIELVSSFLKENNNELYTTLLENCLVNVDSELSNRSITTYHLCCIHGKLDILKTLIKDANDNIDEIIDLNTLYDNNHMTCLDYAILHSHHNIVEFLSKIGYANINQSNHNVMKSNDINNAMTSGMQILSDVKKQNITAVDSALHNFPTELCQLVVAYVSNIDMIHAANQY